MPRETLVYPFEVLSFPALAVPYHYPNGCTFDATGGSSLAQGLRLTLHANSRHFTQFNDRTPISFDRTGPAISFQSTNRHKLVIPHMSPGNDFSFFIRMRATSLPGDTIDSSIISFPPYFLFRWDHDDGGTRIGSIAFDTAGQRGSVKIKYTWHTRWLTLSFNCGYDYQGFIDGVPMSFQSLEDDSALVFNEEFTVGTSWRGHLSLLHYWNRSLSRSEHLSLHQDPYCLLNPS